MPRSRQRKKKKPVQHIPKQIAVPGKTSAGIDVVALVKSNETKVVKHIVKPSNVGVSPKKKKPFKVDKAHVQTLRGVMGIEGTTTGRIKSQ